MKQFDSSSAGAIFKPSISKDKSIKSDSSQRLFCRLHVKLSYLLCSLLMIAFSFTSNETKAWYRANWADNDGYWTVNYNEAEGTIHVKVRVYDDDYGPGGEDGYVDNAHLQYSINGIDFTDFEYIDYNSGPSLQDVSARSGATTSYTSSTSGSSTWLDITLKLKDGIKNIQKIRITGSWDVNGAYGSDGIDGTRSVTITQMSIINTPTYEFVTVQSNGVNQPKARVSYTKSTLNNVDKLSTIKLYNSANTALSGDMAISTSGSFDVSTSNNTGTYYYKQSAYGGDITTTSANVTVPAFTFPKTATATYDTIKHQASFTWTIDPVTTSNLVKDAFKLQVADNPNFTDAKEVNVDYDQTKSSYSYVVDKNLTPVIYFRVARNHTGTNWNLWDVFQSASVTIPFVSLNPNKITLTLQTDNTALITWDTTMTTVWLPGSSFVITKLNNTSKTEQEFKLTEADFKKAFYIDKQIALCNEYFYSLQILPPDNSGFTAFAAIQIANSILPTQIGTIFSLSASKGYFPDRTELKWSSQGAFDNFIVKRAVYGTTNFVQLSSVTGSSTSDYQTDDPKGTPGVYYKYMVVGVVNCNGKAVYSKDTLYAIGFRSPTGNIYGRVIYDNGQAVENVAVRLQNNDATQLGQSIYLNGNSQSYLKLDSLNKPFTDSALTVETWIKPDDASPKNQVIFSRGGQYELGFNNTGQLYFAYRTKTVTGTYNNPNKSFIHVAGIHQKNSLILMVNDSVIATIADQYQAANTSQKLVYIGRNTTGNYFKGYIDEMRVWNVAIDTLLVARDYTRMLAGGENGLAAYWRFDETIQDQFYDASHKNDQYNQNDGVMNATNVIHSSVIPTPDQLALKAYTDVSGNYMISGIPFTGNGITYTIVPLLGTHQFDPASVNRLISANSTEFTVDFKDKSSFPVSGYVYYSHGTVPVSGVQFKIDGQYAQQGNGDIIETDASGKFTISVPVGTHEVKAVKNNHVFENNGMITDRTGHNLNYQGPVSERVLNDSTTIRFIGRVAGGAIEEAYPLGHSLSTNNLGKVLSITMDLPSGTKYELYSGATDSTAIVKHFVPSNQTNTNKVHQSRVVYSKNKIVIYPDSLTGEFAADFIPEKFLVDNVNATGWGDLLDGKPVSIDFSDKFVVQNSANNYKDSTQAGQSGWTYTNYSDTVKYNDSYKFIKRVTPSVTISQTDNSGKDLSYFGNVLYEALSFTGKKDSIAVVDPAKTGKAMYLLGNPVFKQNELYHFKVKAFEEYPFYESVNNNGTPVIAQQNGKDLIFNVPTQDGHVSIFNKVRNGPADADTFSLNSNGEANYDFTAGDPDIAAKGLKSFGASIQFGQATNINWNWYGNPQMLVYVMGGKMTGTDFVTAGPDKLLMVLRDPPGSRSYSYAENGSTISNSNTYSGSFDQVGDLALVTKLGAELVTFTGVGVGTINSAVTSTGIGYGIHHEEHYTGTNTKETSTTLTTRFQSSDDPAFVGAPADVFVGYSTNITYGLSNNITIIRRSEIKATDVTIYEPSPTSEYLIVQRSGINLGENFGTLFAYPQQHIEKVLIPNLVTIRNTILLPSTTSSADAQAVADAGKKEVYVSKLSPTDPNFGKSNTDSVAFGAAAKTDPFGDGKSYKIYFPATSAYRTDTVMTLNQYVSSWNARLADNEKAKLESTLLQNYSFHAGTPLDYSQQTTINQTTTNSFNIVIAGSISNSTDVKILGNGFEFNVNESVGTTQGGDFGNTTETSSTVGFTLASDGTDDYFSVDVNKAGDGSFAFRTKGGVSGCPYEGATLTQYYQKGTVLDQPTQRIEVPKLDIDNPVAANVASSRPASYNLLLRNESEAKMDGTFVLSYVDNDSIKGATLSVDGTPIGGSGRTIVVKYGETLTKVLTLTKGPNAMDYNNIMVVLHSGCQYDPTGYQETIADTVLVSAHFIPSCSDIHLKSPVDKWVLNTDTKVNDNGKRYLPVVMDQFDVNNSLFDHIELQYKPSSSSTWITAMKFYADSAKFKVAQGDKLFITNAQAINYNLVMDDAAFNDQNYDIQAVSICQLSPGNFVTTESNKVSGIKDTYYPRLFGSPQPANGILGINDEIQLNFNEPIAAGLLTYPDFQVTGIRNGLQGDHSVSVRLDGQSDYMASEFDKNLSGKNITAEMWILPNGPADGTLFSQGNINSSMELALTSDNHLEAIIGKKTVKSDKAVDYKQGEWAHVALVYNATTNTISAFYNFTQVISNVSVDSYNGVGHFEFGHSISKQGNFFAGKMHQVRIWTDVLTAASLQVNSLTRLSGAEPNLMAYYPMNEGKGNVVYDKAHSSNAQLIGYWSTPAGKAIMLNGNGYVKMNTSISPITSSMDYTMELWFKGQSGQTDATLVSNGKGDGNEADSSLNLFSLGFENGLLTYQNNKFKIQADGNYLDNNWHHVAIAVNRNSGNAQFFVDGLLNKYVDAKNLGGIAAASTYIGVRAWHNADSSTVTNFDRYFKGNVDEFRIWNTYLNQTLISNNNNIRLKGDEIGLIAYYPFEKYFTFQNNQEMGFTLSDMKIQTASVPDAVAINATENDDMAPIIDRGPVDNLKFDFVVNNDGLIINMQEPMEAIDKTIITFKVKNVRDLNGNQIVSPITWTAYIDRNQLKWSDDILNLTKDVNAPMQFESYIVNNGGNVQHFRLDNMPSWLTASATSGTVDPKAKQKITFTVSEGLNVGTYDEIVYMRNDNNEAEALSLNIKVNGKKPDWTVNPSDFKYNMSIYGKLRLNNIFSIDKEDMLAAFIDGKCVGVTNNTYNAANDLWYTFLTVYSDLLEYDKIEFRIWQSSTGKTYLASPSQAIAFKNDAIIGTSRNPVIFDGKEMVTQDITLNKNWNWISFNVASPTFTDVKATLANGLWLPGDIVKNEEMGFSQYSSASGWVGYLQAFNNTSLFMLKTGNEQTLSVNGTAVNVKTTPIHVKGNRWSYISYLPQKNATVKDALAGYDAGDEDVIKSQSGFAMYDSRNGWVGNLTYMEPGKGYMIYRKATTDTSFVYPSLGTGRSAGRGTASTANTLETPVDNNFNFAQNMTVAAIVGSEFIIQPTDNVLAYVGSDLRGKAQAIYNAVSKTQTFFLNVAGEQQETVHFKVERNGQVIGESETVINYQPNVTMGTLSKPMVIHFKNEPASVQQGITFYPNPFTNKVNIIVNMAPVLMGGTHQVQISIIDALGQLVVKRGKETIGSNQYQTSWNGKKADGSECAKGIYFINMMVDGELHVYKVVKN